LEASVALKGKQLTNSFITQVSFVAVVELSTKSHDLPQEIGFRGNGNLILYNCLTTGQTLSFEEDHVIEVKVAKTFFINLCFQGQQYFQA